MKKNLFLTTALVLLGAMSAAFCDTVILDWLGSEAGTSAEPKWLTQYTEYGSDAALKKSLRLQRTRLFLWERRRMQTLTVP